MKAVIFDRDGVIIDSEETHLNAATTAFKELRISITEKEKSLLIGRHPVDYLKDFLKKYSFSPEEYLKRESELYYKTIGAAKLFEKTISLIKELHRLKVPIALTTSSSRKGTQLILKMANLEKILDVIVSMEDCKNRKPAPDSYLATSRKLGVDPKDCVVIEDSAVGLEAAKRAGMKCIIIPNQSTRNQDFSKADLIVDSADKLTIEILKSM